ncbi:MAG: putative Diguanylate cyclase/phosphodiesterase, partial [Acidimicrobiia bacterium]|nr:putative Diguanylate cyclase/phosphodiesterase [Acidimicrobiia bacterium]
ARLLVNCTASSLALGTVVLYDLNRWLALAPFGFVAFSLYELHRVDELRRRFQDSQALYAFSTILATADSSETGLPPAMDFVLDRLNGTAAELTMFDVRPDGQRQAGVWRFERGSKEPIKRPVRPEDLSVSDRTLALGTPAVLLASDSEAAGELAARYATDAVVAPLGTTGQVSGVLAVCDRLGNVSEWERADATLLASLATQLGFWFERAELADRLRDELAERAKQAVTDELTGLHNRRGIVEVIGTALNEARKDETAGGLLLMDLDRFQDVNDTLGHAAGDDLLRMVARRIELSLPPGCELARLGGDEFLVVLPTIGDGDVMVLMAAELRHVLEEQFSLRGQKIRVEASMGWAVFPADASSPEDLIRRADVALYVAKRNRIGACGYNAALDPHSTERLSVLAELKEALDEGSLLVYFQPKVRLDTGRVMGVEALIRWQRADGRMIPPNEFIAAAERTGLIEPLFEFVLRSSLLQARMWMSKGIEISVAVNVSGRNLSDPKLERVVARALNEFGVPPERLTLELIERSVLHDDPRTLGVLERLSASGVKLALDDFGTGQQTLSDLLRLPVHEIKIDSSFVIGMLPVDQRPSHANDDQDPESNAALVRRLVQLGRDLGKEVVAEGIENEWVMDQLRAFGCDIGQGFHICRPAPAEVITSWIEQNVAASPQRVLGAHSSAA